MKTIKQIKELIIDKEAAVQEAISMGVMGVIGALILGFVLTIANGFGIEGTANTSMHQVANDTSSALRFVPIVVLSLFAGIVMAAFGYRR